MHPRHSTRGAVVTVEIDGTSSPQELRNFADRSRVPVGLRAAYVRFAMRTVVGVVPNREQLAVAFAGLSVSGLTVSRLEDMPLQMPRASSRG
jgi:hypothetical protein